MWWKLFLLGVYLTALFILSRLLETVAYYEGGYLASRLLDPVSLSVRKLKLLLDQRGVSYAGVVEKQELTDLIESSGEVLEGELEAATGSEETTATPTNFTGGLHFYEEVEDTKDSVWLVQVTGYKRREFMSNQDWTLLTHRLAHFGIRTGNYNCGQDLRLCESKNWYSSRLVLAVPKGFRAKDKVILRSYTGPSKIQAVFDWVNSNLASRIKSVYSMQNVTNEWTNEEKKQDSGYRSKLSVLLFSHMPIPPMFLSVLSVKFTGRVKFGTVNASTKEGRTILSKMKFKKVPNYLVITSDKNYTFGENKGEYWNYNSMSLFLKTLHPEVNDIFLLSLIVVNVMCWLEFFVVRGTLFKRLGSLLWHVGKWNFLLILLWLPVLGLFQLPYMDRVLEYCLRLLQMLALTSLGCEMRSDWLWYLSVDYTFLVATFLTFAVSVGILHYIYQGEQTTDNNNNLSEWWNFQWETYMSALFHPMATLTRPMARPDDLEVGMEMLIERLAVPNFWLRPMISSEYMQDLPVWKYSGPCIDSDIGSDFECTSLQSDCEGYLSDADSVCSASSDGSRRPIMFICERCRALQARDEDVGKSDSEIEQERAETESACAKYLMDGDYKCMCGVEHGQRRSPRKERHKSKTVRERKTISEISSDRNTTNLDSPPIDTPPGIIPTTECAICLESYKMGVVLCGLPCGHAFHQNCIMGWLHRDNHCCPVCRWPPYKAKPCSLHAHIE